MTKEQLAAALLANNPLFNSLSETQMLLDSGTDLTKYAEQAVFQAMQTLEITEAENTDVVVEPAMAFLRAAVKEML